MTTLLETYDALLLDLDGTLFRGGTALPGARAALDRAASRNVSLGYLTNNGSRSARQVAEHLAGMGFAAAADEVVTSGQAAAQALVHRLPARSQVLVVGSPDLAAEVRAVGLGLTDDADRADAVVQGHSPDTAWPLLAEACLAIRRGALWVACNVDATLPTERGELPGNGSMVAALRTATGVEPVVAGKPEPWLFEEAVRRTGARRPLVVGDRLDTDIVGATAAGLPALLVLTGVSGAGAVLGAAEPERPRYLGADLTALDLAPEAARVGVRPPWTVQRADSDLVLGASGAEPRPDPVAALRALCAVHWRSGGGPVGVLADGDIAADALVALGLGAPVPAPHDAGAR